ncbi:histone-lysine N-methyltransferase SETMAR [Trichonephila clavipes]|nr:histone-lysine N-methyltransferase SETMAR [Trichonephila clavipes]
MSRLLLREKIFNRRYLKKQSRGLAGGIFDVKDAPRIGRPVVDNVDKITETIEVDRPVSSCSITQELKIDHKIVLSHLRQVRIKKEARFLGATLINIKNMMDRISICEALTKRNEIDPFLSGW